MDTLPIDTPSATLRRMTAPENPRRRVGRGRHLSALGAAVALGLFAGVVATFVFVSVDEDAGLTAGFGGLMISGLVAVGVLGAYGWQQAARASLAEVQRLRAYGDRLAAFGGAVWGTGSAILVAATGTYVPGWFFFFLVLYVVASVLLAAASRWGLRARVGVLAALFISAAMWPWNIPSLVAQVALLTVTWLVTRRALKPAGET